MRKIKKLTDNQKFAIILITTSISNGGALAFVITALNYFLTLDFALISLYLSLTFFSLTLSSINSLIYYRIMKNNRIAFFKHIAFSLIYLTFAIIFLAVPDTPVVYVSICGIYVLTIAANRVCRVFEERKIFKMVFNSFLALVSLALALIMFLTIEEAQAFATVLLLTMIIIMFISLVNLMVFAFSRIQLRTLLKIIRKTFALEILYGLFVLIFSFSFVFTIFEDTFTNYGDALWYSFAVVTTIGFGDFVATGPITRVLSVVLGIYGIVVVALITSVIVNFYNEVKAKSDKEEEEKLKETSNKEDKTE